MPLGLPRRITKRVTNPQGLNPGRETALCVGRKATRPIHAQTGETKQLRGYR